MRRLLVTTATVISLLFGNALVIRAFFNVAGGRASGPHPSASLQYLFAGALPVLNVMAILLIVGVHDRGRGRFVRLALACCSLSLILFSVICLCFDEQLLKTYLEWGFERIGTGPGATMDTLQIVGLIGVAMFLFSAPQIVVALFAAWSIDVLAGVYRFGRNNRRR